MSVSIALRAFFSALFNPDVARGIKEVLDGSHNEVPNLEPPTASSVSGCSKDASTALKLSATPRSDSRSEALELLAALQRDARFIDFIKEDIGACDDVSLAAAARATHDRCAATLERFFQIRPLSRVQEGETTKIDPASQNPARFRISGASSHPLGTEVACRVAHAGWIAEKCEPPRWSGKGEDAMVLAPAELEIERS